MYTVTLSAVLKTSFALCAVTALLACSGGGNTKPSGSSGSSSSITSTGSSVSTSSSVSSSASTSSSSQSSQSSAANCAHGGTPTAVGAAVTRIEAEDYDVCDGSFSDTTAANEGDTYRDDGVDIGAGSGASQGYFVQSMRAGEYLEYSVDVFRSGLYRVAYRARNTSVEDAGLSIAIHGQVIDNSDVNIASDTWSDHTKTLYLTEGHQTLRLQVSSDGAETDYLELSYLEETTITPQAAVEAMGIGINMGNTLDAPHEGDWALPAQKQYFEAYQEAGFDHVRVPVTWHAHTATTEPYAVNADFMNRVEQIVDWALAQGYYVILNAHHETWLKTDYRNSVNRDRFDAIWMQIAERFQHKSSRLIFEMLNEPEGMTMAQVNELNGRILQIIRTHNPNRLVIFSGNGFTPADSLIAAAIPNDDYLIGNFHSYDPWPFAGQCTRTWGSQADMDALAAIYQRVDDWSQENDIPVMVNEFGVAHYDYTQPQNVCDQGSRLAYLQTHVNLATENGFAATVWDDGGSFVIYHRDDGTWEEEKDILVNPNP